ncbi:MAG: MCE family protein [Cyanobacteria bacterium SBLK]|nr:MCE family protein [Cyanobacteria bacterium SBLK]
MRSRTIREGSVGLFILIGLAVFGTLTVWLRGLRLGADSYEIEILFDNTNGMAVGGAVRYRGYKVGNITAITPETNGVVVTVSIAPPDLFIPQNSRVETLQAGLIAETGIEITPLRDLRDPETLADPLSSRCDSTLIVCQGDRIQGDSGITFNDALRSTVTMSERLTDAEFFEQVKALTENANLAVRELAVLGKELGLLSKTTRVQLSTVSRAANSITNAADSTTAQLNNTVEEYGLLASNLNTIIADNRGSLQTTLGTLGQTSQQLQLLLVNLNQAVGGLDTADTMQHLEELTANAAAASASLRDVTNSFNDPATLMTLQRTLNSARVTFENTQKITSDLEELTGNPEFRNNILRLVDGLSGLVSSTDELSDRIQTARQLEEMQEKLTLEPEQPPTEAVEVLESEAAIAEEIQNSEEENQNRENTPRSPAVNGSRDPVTIFQAPPLEKTPENEGDRIPQMTTEEWARRIFQNRTFSEIETGETEEIENQ